MFISYLEIYNNDGRIPNFFVSYSINVMSYHLAAAGYDLLSREETTSKLEDVQQWKNVKAETLVQKAFL